MKSITKQQEKEINKIRSLFPSQINVRTHRSENGKYCAEITTYPGSFTEADTFSSLIEMVNDCMRTYFEVPEKYFSYVPPYLPPISAVQEFGIFPVVEETKDLKFQNLNVGAKS